MPKQRKIPKPNAPKPTARPILANIPTKKNWTFSFRFWKQTESFGLSEQKRNWFISLLDRLQTLSNTALEELLNTGMRDTLRFHEIDWNGINVPIKRQDFTWISNQYLKNETEYPFMQIAISKALGRIIGFFDDNNIFNIILLDPMHNLQPSNYADYKVRPTTIGTCSYSNLIHKVEKHISQCQCPSKQDLSNNFYKELDEQHRGIVIMNIEDRHLEELRNLITSGIFSNAGEILTEAIQQTIKNYTAIEN